MIRPQNNTSANSPILIFQKARCPINFNYLDQNPDKDFDVSCVVIGVQPTEYNKNGKALNKCTLQDAANRSETLKVYQGNNPPLTQANIGQSLIFKLKRGTFNGRGYYQGFWQCPNPQQNQPQNAPQATNYQNPVPATHAPQNVAPAQRQALTDKDLQIMRQTAGKILGPFVPDWARERGGNGIASWIAQAAIPMLDWFGTGRIPMTEAPEPEAECDNPFPE